MLVDGGKMSKSLGNTYTLADLKDRGYDPLVFRYFCLNAHYRSKLNFTWDGLQSAKVSYERLLQAVAAHKGVDAPADQEALEKLQADFEDAINDDLNVPKALGLVWSMARLSQKSDQVYKAILKCDEILGLDLDRGPVEEAPAEDLDAGIEAMIAARQEARKNKNFAEADRIRDELKAQGILLEDTKDGVKWRRI